MKKYKEWRGKNSRLYHDPSVFESHDTICVGRKILRMCDHDDGLPLFVESYQEVHNLSRRDRVEIPSRLICEDNLGIIHERTSDRHPLLLSSGELTREVIGLLGNS